MVAASDKYVIMACENIHISDNANKLLEQFESDLEQQFNRKVNLIFITNERWLNEKQKYIENIKNGVKYSYIEEEKQQQEDIIISDVFDKSKVEII